MKFMSGYSSFARYTEGRRFGQLVDTSFGNTSMITFSQLKVGSERRMLGRLTVNGEGTARTDMSNQLQNFSMAIQIRLGTSKGSCNLSLRRAGSSTPV